jgi:hypothetical protein
MEAMMDAGGDVEDVAAHCEGKFLEELLELFPVM